MTKRQAALRGAVAAMACATAAAVVVSVGLRLAGIADEETRSGFLMDELRLFYVAGRGNLAPWAFLCLPAAGISGALVGLAARKVRARRWIRILVLWLGFFPALAVGAGLALGVGGNLVEWSQGRSAVIANPLGMLFFGALGTVLFTPVLAVPLLLAAVTVERWARPQPPAAAPAPGQTEVTR